MKQADNLKMEDNLFYFRNYIIKDLVDRGYKYIARDKDGTIYAYSNKPVKLEKSWLFIKHSNTNYRKNISLVSCIFTDIKWECVEPFRISCADLDSVPVDTKVIVTGLDGSEWHCHFCKKLNDNSILVFRDGKTSWTTDDVVEVLPVPSFTA